MEEGEYYDIGERLYRDSTNKIWGGICGGLGLFFGIDPLFFRLLFIFLTFLGGLGFVLYLILWLITVPAKTDEEKKAQRGTHFGIESIKRKIKENLSGDGVRSVEKLIDTFYQIFSIIRTTINQLFRMGVPILRVVFGLFFVVCGLVLFCLITALAIVGAGQLAHYPSPIFSTLYSSSALFVFTFFSSLWIVKSWPFLFFIVLGASLIFKRNLLSFRIFILSFAVWAASFILSIILFLLLISVLPEKIRTTEKFVEVYVDQIIGGYNLGDIKKPLY